MNAKMRSGLGIAMFAIAMTGHMPAMAGDTTFDNQLERWAMERAAARVDAPLRGTYGADETARLVTLVDLATRGSPLDARLIVLERQMLKPFADL